MVGKRNRSKSSYYVVDDALDLAAYSTNVLANTNIFIERYQKVIDKMQYNAIMLYHYCRAANDKRTDKTLDELKARNEAQATAIKHCENLYTLVMISKKIFHLRTKRVTYWTGMIDNLIEEIKKWILTDQKNYKQKHGL